MSTYNNWPLIAIPGTPPAPQSIDLEIVDFVSGNISVFTGQQQVYDWNSQYLQGSVNMPPMRYVDAQEWVAFLKLMRGISGVFQFTAAFMAAYPNDIGGKYWKLRSNVRKYSITKDRVYGFSFEIREAI